MRDAFHILLNWVDHNRYLAFASVLAGAVLLFTTACEPRAQSPFTDEAVTQSQLVAQSQAYQAQLDARVKSAELTYQDTLAHLQADATAHQVAAAAALQEIAQKKQAIHLALESLATIASTAAGPQYASMIGSAVGIAGVLLGLGAAADSQRKDNVILQIKASQSPTTTPGALPAA